MMVRPIRTNRYRLSRGFLLRIGPTGTHHRKVKQLTDASPELWRVLVQRTASLNFRMGTSVQEGWRESSRTSRSIPAPRSSAATLLGQLRRGNLWSHESSVPALTSPRLAPMISSPYASPLVEAAVSDPGAVHRNECAPVTTQRRGMTRGRGRERGSTCLSGSGRRYQSGSGG